MLFAKPRARDGSWRAESGDSEQKSPRVSMIEESS